jgi:hypothetical protein
VTDGSTKEVLVFLLNLFDRHGGQPGGFKRELWRRLLRELGDWADVDLSLEE